MLAQAPAGALVDWSNRKKWLIALGAVAIMLGCLGIVLAPTVALETLTEVIDRDRCGRLSTYDRRDCARNSRQAEALGTNRQKRRNSTMPEM